MNLTEYKKIAEPLKPRTLCFLLRENQVLLGMKKTGFGKGYWLGIGGKVEFGERLEDAVIREVQEEIFVTLHHIERVATLNFYFPKASDPSKRNQQVCVYVAHEWFGNIGESAEIAPKWFEKDNIPLDEMWDDAHFWLPNVLKGESLKADFLFDEGLKVVESKVEKGGYK